MCFIGEQEGQKQIETDVLTKAKLLINYQRWCCFEGSRGTFTTLGFQWKKIIVVFMLGGEGVTYEKERGFRQNSCEKPAP